MISVSISNFSCLKDASFDLSPICIFIGEQGAGKSVTTKMIYFISDILVSFLQHTERGDTLADFKKIIAKSFSLWFPPSAWGSERFSINYTASEFNVRILRRKSSGRLSDEVVVTFSDWFNNLYNDVLGLFKNANEVRDVSEEVEESWRIQTRIRQRISDTLGGDYLSRQTFIPAGRGFFTSIGRIVAGFDQVGSLDPLTIRFARLFANSRDMRFRTHYFGSRINEDYIEKRNKFMKSFFGGEIKIEGEKEFISTEDGRMIPFSALSSGQQELLPMWTLIDSINQVDAFSHVYNKQRRISSHMLYIEEPEAHLFPSAQSTFMEFLIGSSVSRRDKRSIIITTHSPYIMAKINNFLKAGQLSRKRKFVSKVEKIIPKDLWIHRKQLSAFSIDNGKIKDLLDEDGLIDARYLDQISEDVSNEFSNLLDIEAEL